MATPKFFSNYPNIEYGTSMDKSGNVDYVNIKDYFNGVRLRDYDFKRSVVCEPYTIKSGERPDQISYEMYGNEAYYWIILQVNDIVDFYQQWPLSQYELDEYVKKKYGARMEDTHHYETIEIRDSKGNIVLPGRGSLGPDRGGMGRSGLTVSGDFSFTYLLDQTTGVYATKEGYTGQNAVCIPITNRQYEYDLNEDKSQINILKKELIPIFLRDLTKYTGGLEDHRSVLDVSDLE